MRLPVSRPPRLRRGETIGVVSPSWGGAGVFPHRVERGVAQLEALGFRVKLGRHALNGDGWVSDTPENRAADLHEMFADPAVRLVLAAVGGDHSCHLLPHLDFELVRRNPKPLVGFSDITVLNVALWAKTGLVTFNGPALLTDFAEYPDMIEYTRSSFLAAVTRAEPLGVVAPAGEWTEEFLDWGSKADLARARTMTPSAGWTWLKPGRSEGVLIGGCIDSLQHLRGTPFWPDWTDAILFFETSELKPTPATIDGILMDYENMGVLEKLRGMLVGRPMSYSNEEKAQLRQVVLERTRSFHFPIVTDMDFGHTAGQMTLPLGCRARIDAGSQTFEILEPAVS